MEFAAKICESAEFVSGLHFCCELNQIPMSKNRQGINEGRIGRGRPTAARRAADAPFFFVEYRRAK